MKGKLYQICKEVAVLVDRDGLLQAVENWRQMSRVNRLSNFLVAEMPEHACFYGLLLLGRQLFVGGLDIKLRQQFEAVVHALALDTEADAGRVKGYGQSTIFLASHYANSIKY